MLQTPAGVAAQIGIKDQAAGTAVRQMYSELIGTSAKARKVMQETLRFDAFDELGKSLKPLPQMFAELSAAFVKLDFKSQNRALLDMGNERATKAIAANLRAVQGEVQKSAKEFEAMGLTTEQAMVRSKEAVTSNMDKIRTQLEDAPGFSALAAIGLGNSTQNQMKYALAGLQTSLVEAFQAVEPVVARVATQLQMLFKSEEFRTGLTAIVSGVAELTGWLARNFDLIAVGAIGYYATTLAMTAYASITTILSASAAAASANQVLLAAGTTLSAGAAAAATVSFGALALTLLPLTLLIAAVGGAYWFLTKKVDETAAARENEQASAYRTLESVKAESERLRILIEAKGDEALAREESARVLEESTISAILGAGAEKVKVLELSSGYLQLAKAKEQSLGGWDAMGNYTSQDDGSAARLQDLDAQIAKIHEMTGAQVFSAKAEFDLLRALAKEARTVANARRVSRLPQGDGTYDGDKKGNAAAANAKSAYDALKQQFNTELGLLDDRAKLEDGAAKLREATTKSTYNLGITDFKAYQSEMDRLQSDHAEARLRTAVEAQALANKFLQESTKLAAKANARQVEGKKLPVAEEKLLADQADALRKVKLESDKVQQLRNQQATEELARMEQAASQMVKASRAALDKLDNSKLELGFLREQTAERSAQMLLVGREADVEAARLQSRDSFRKAERDLVREIAQYELQIASSKSLSGTGEYVSPADALRDPARRQQLALAAAHENVGKLRAQGPIDSSARETEAGSLYDAKALAKLLDPQKAQDYGNALKGVLGEANADVVNLAMSMDTLGESMKGAFGSAGAALGQLMGALQSYGAKQGQIDAARRGAMQMEMVTVEGAAARENALSRISSKEMSAKIGAYGDMAGAAKGFFQEGTTGYKTLDGVAKVAHMAQVAMNLVEMGQLAVKAVLNQASGDPYTAFFRMAAMAAAVGALGFAVGGGFNSAGGGESAADLQKRQGSGTVLGDSSTKSNSLLSAMESLQSNTFTQLKYSSGMLDALRSIQRAMSGLASIVFRVGGITSGNPQGLYEGTTNQSFGQTLGNGALGVGGELRAADKLLGNVPVIGSIIKMFGKTTQSISDSGLSINGNLGGLTQGRGVQQYTDIETKSSSWFGLVKKTSSSTQYSELNAGVSKQFGMVFQGISDSIKLAGVSFGMDTETLAKKLADSVINIPKLSLRGLKGKELQDALEAVFSGAADGLAQSVIPGLEELQKVGEGYYETIIRASSALSTTNGWLKRFKMELLGVSAAGAIAATKLADLFGGINELNAANQAFYEGYFTEAERAAQSTEDMRAALKTVNLALPESKEALRAMVAGLDLSTEAGREAYKVLLSIAPEFANLATALDKLSKESAAKLIKTFTADGTLVPALNDAQLNTLRLRDSLTSTYTVAGAISTLFLNASSGLITFGSTTAALTNGLTGAQVAGQALSDSIESLRNGAGQARIDTEGLAKALAGVDTKTFMHTIEMVLESLAGRIKATLGAIGNERVAVREAALRIIDPGVMTRDAILRGISGISVSAPGNGALLQTQASLLQADTLTAQKRQLLDQAKAQTPSRSALTAAEAALAAFTGPSRAAFTGAATPGGWERGQDPEGTPSSTWVNGTPGAFDQGGYDAAYRDQRAPLANNLANQLTQYAGSAMLNAAAIARAQDELAAAAQRQAAAVLAARAAQLAYIGSLQNSAIEASKAVGKLSRLREETMKYYESQKQLADLMKNSAQGLRTTVADYRFSQMTDAQKFDKLQSEYAKNYAMGLSTEGSTLAGYGDKLNAGLNPLLEAARNTLSADAYKTFAATALARAEAIAARLDTLTPTNYAADSLEMLGAIDSALAAIEASSKSAEKIISEAIAAGSDKTAAGLRAVIAALTGQPIPGFASGGDFAGGLRIVGERGPELEVTGPSRIFNAGQTRDLLGGGGNNNSELVYEVRALTAQVARLSAEAQATAANTGKLAKLADRDRNEGVLTVRAAKPLEFLLECR